MFFPLTYEETDEYLKQRYQARYQIGLLEVPSRLHPWQRHKIKLLNKQHTGVWDSMRHKEAREIVDRQKLILDFNDLRESYDKDEGTTQLPHDKRGVQFNSIEDFVEYEESKRIQLESLQKKDI